MSISESDYPHFGSAKSFRRAEKKSDLRIESTPRLFTIEMRQDDPAKCTSAKMTKFRLARQISARQIPAEAIVLSPYSPESILKSDRETITSRGLVIVDCSWVNAVDVFHTKLRGTKRRLPVLMAGNPTNYSKLNSLSSLEAAAAALYITSYDTFSKRLLSLYKWGDTFLSLNQDALNDYANATSQQEIQDLETDYFGK
jgi:pre-rRNA-processing protein TSR3